MPIEVDASTTETTIVAMPKTEQTDADASLVEQTVIAMPIYVDVEVSIP